MSSDQDEKTATATATSTASASHQSYHHSHQMQHINSTLTYSAATQTKPESHSHAISSFIGRHRPHTSHHSPQLHPTPPRGILKHISSHSLQHSSSSSFPTRRNNKRSHSIHWDEANLLQNEGEKIPRMKIDEPKTPYRHSVHDSADEMSELEQQETRAASFQDTFQHMTDDEQTLSANHSHATEQLQRKQSWDQTVGYLDEKRVAMNCESESDDEPSVDVLVNGSWSAERDSALPAEEVARKKAHFEQLKRQHYHAMANPLRRHSQDLGLDDEDEDEKQ